MNCPSACSRLKLRRIAVTVIACAVFVQVPLIAQQENSPEGAEFGIAWSHMTGNFGLDGFDLNAGWWFSPKVAMSFNYGNLYDNSSVVAFTTSSLGSVTVKSRLQNILVGPRIAFDSLKRDSKAIPFAELLFGGSHLRTTISQAIPGENNASDSAFTWALGGGIDYAVSPHWTARINLDFVRTHFADAGQSRLRLGMGGAYTFGTRR